MKTQETRYYFVDAIRGIAITNMVIFHFLYDVYMIYGKNPNWYGLPQVHVWQQMICQTFIFISGFVWQWGMAQNLRRGLRFHLYGILISLITLTVIPSETIWFGILNFMGSAVLLMFPLQKAAEKMPPSLGMGICFTLFVFCSQIQYGFLGIGDVIHVQVPAVLYSVKVLTPFGFPFPGFRSSDYFPILPWMLLYLCGYFFHEIFMRHHVLKQIARYRIPVLSVIGSRTIWIYLLHQPVSMLVCSVVFHFRE